MHIGIGATRTGDVILSVGYQYGTSVDVGRLVILNLHLALGGVYIKNITIGLITDGSGHGRCLGIINRNSDSRSVVCNLGRMPVSVRSMGNCYRKLCFRQKNPCLTDIGAAVNLNLHFAILCG